MSAWLASMITNTIPMIFPTDLARAARFYTEVLGFVESFAEDDLIELKSGNQTIWLHGDTGLEDEVYQKELHDHKRGVGVNLSFEVTDLQAYHKRVVEQAGAPVEQPIASTPWGTKRFTVRDPDGVHLSFFAYE